MLTICRSFTDDSSLQESSYNELDTEQKLNHVLHVLEVWSNERLLKFNTSKTNVVFFSKKEISVMPKLFFNGDRFEIVLFHCHLDLLFSHYSWTNFIDAVVNIAFEKPGLLKKKPQVQNWQIKTYQNCYIYQTYA